MGIDSPNGLPTTVCINIRGREEHERIIKDKDTCKELGIDQIFETIVYLKRWGGWLEDAKPTK